MNSSLPSYDLNRLFAANIPKDSGGEAMILEEADNDGDDDDTEEEDREEDSLEDQEGEKEVLMSDSLNAVSWSEDAE